MGRPVKLSTLGLCGSLVLLACISESTAQGLAPDMAVRFDCPGNVTPRFESDIETFLTEKGFKVANLERVRRQFNVGFYPLEIEGYDSRRWMVHLISLNTTYSLGLYSPPPTQHDAVLERDLIDLITQRLKCTISSLNHSENGPEAKGIFDRVYSTRLSRDREADVCDRTAKTFDANLCQRVPGVK